MTITFDYDRWGGRILCFWIGVTHLNLILRIQLLSHKTRVGCLECVTECCRIRKFHLSCKRVFLRISTSLFRIMIESLGNYPKDCQRCGKLETNCKSLLASSGPDSFVSLFATTMQKESSNPKEQGKKHTHLHGWWSLYSLAVWHRFPKTKLKSSSKPSDWRCYVSWRVSYNQCFFRNKCELTWTCLNHPSFSFQLVSSQPLVVASSRNPGHLQKLGTQVLPAEHLKHPQQSQLHRQSRETRSWK